MIKAATLVTDLIGATIEPLFAQLVGQASGPWPINEPNASGEHIATIRCVWLEDSSVQILAVTPSGVSFETYMKIVKVRMTK